MRARQLQGVSLIAPSRRLVRLRGLSWVTWMAVALLAPIASWGQSPPRNLKLVNDHWTAWDPPAAIEEGAEVHTIQRGDTLWDLASRFLGNPYLWPQIWERNSYILDAHWIYPGDPLVLGLRVESAEALEQPTPEPEAAVAVPDAVPSRPTDPFSRTGVFGLLGSTDDIYCSGYIGTLDEEFPNRVIGSEYEVLGPALNLEERGELSAALGAIDAIKIGLTSGDIVYVDGGRAAGMMPGDLLQAVMRGPVVRHPVRGNVVGRVYEYQGRVRLLSVQEDTAIGEVAQSCQPLAVGASLKRFVPEPIPSERRTPLRPVNEPVAQERLASAPMILYAKDGLVTVAQDHVVFIELPDGNAEPGDIFTVYRRSGGRRPPVVIGEVAILSVHPTSAVAKVIESRYPIYVGDVLDPK